MWAKKFVTQYLKISSLGAWLFQLIQDDLVILKFPNCHAKLEVGIQNFCMQNRSDMHLKQGRLE